MPKFNVTLEEICRYTITVEAENEQQAVAAAEEEFVQSENPWADFVSEVTERETFMVLPATENET